MKDYLVIGIGTEVIKLVNDVYSFFDSRPEIGYVPLALGIDVARTEHLMIELVTFGVAKQRQDERPVLRSTLRNDLERSKEKIVNRIKRYDCDIILIANIGGGTGSVVLTNLSRWLKELRKNICVICIAPFTRVPTYRPILTDNAIPSYRDLKGMLHKEINSIIYMDRNASEYYTDFDDAFRNLLIDLLLINNETCLLSNLNGEYTAGCKRISFRYGLFSRDFVFLEADGCENTEKGLEISSIRPLADPKCIHRTVLCPYLLVSEDTRKKLKMRGLSLSVADVVSNSHDIEVENLRHCDWIYHNSMEFVTIFKGLHGYLPLDELIKSSAEYQQKKKEAEVELKFEYDEHGININSLNASKVGTLKQDDLYFDVGKGKELRLRSDESGCRITYKSKRDEHPLIRHELEMVIGSLDDFKRLFEELGYNIKGIVNKEREEYLVYHDDDEYILTFDSVDDIGRFIEIRKNVNIGDEKETMAKMRAFATTIGLRTEVKEPYLELVIKKRQ
jgi:predicted adenylyl cyclase CyaB